MNDGSASDRRADLVAAWATGLGIGVAVFMLTWLVANRVTTLIWAPPTGPVIAMAIAIVAGIAASLRHGWRLSRRFVSD
ncbi:MAG TPA: hypothetical protein VJR05_13870 [Acidimicrobiia bacterium]|nr:hypothetical protein [Acidimicrobiia bacterium]